MLDVILGSLFSGLASGFASRRAAPQAGAADLTGSLVPSQVPADPVSPPVPPPSFGASLRATGLDILGRAVQGWAGGRMAQWQAQADGRAARAFNDAAYPGTTAWEQLGSGSGYAGATADLALEAEKLRADKQKAVLASQTQLTATRMQIANTLAGTLLQQGGRANLPLAGEVLRKMGAIPPGMPMNPADMARGHVEAQIESLDAGSLRSNTLLGADLDKAQGDAKRSNIEAAMAPYRLALDEWATKYAKSHAANEARGIAGMIYESFSGAMGEGNTAGLNITQQLLDAIEREYPNYDPMMIWDLKRSLDRIP